MRDYDYCKRSKELSGLTPQEQVELLDGKIREAIKNKQRQIYLTDKFWANEAYDATENYKIAVKLLRGLGYIVEFNYDCKQFVDMGTYVKW